MKGPVNWLWHHQQRDQVRVPTPGSDPSAIQRRFAMKLQSHEGVLHFDKLHYLRKFEEADRIVLIYASFMLVPTNRIQFRNHGHALITPSKTDPLQGRVVTILQQLDVGFQDYREWTNEPC
ncbi:hypothetical protein BBJ28_00002940 [Nothophytophthora sp. Chile5]|nr:hypothetical protein BBJ28_00002940 [Nothophytophthora sp. Chile5]